MEEAYELKETRDPCMELPIHGSLVYDSYSRDMSGAEWVGPKMASTLSLHFENCILPPVHRKRIIRMATM